MEYPHDENLFSSQDRPHLLCTRQSFFNPFLSIERPHTAPTLLAFIDLLLLHIGPSFINVSLFQPDMCLEQSNPWTMACHSGDLDPYNRPPTPALNPSFPKAANELAWIDKLNEEACNELYSGFASTQPKYKRWVETVTPWPSPELRPQGVCTQHESIQRGASMDMDEDMTNAVDDLPPNTLERSGAVSPEAEQPLLHRTTPRLHPQDTKTARVRRYSGDHFHDKASAHENPPKKVLVKTKIPGLSLPEPDAQEEASGTYGGKPGNGKKAGEEPICLPCTSRGGEPDSDSTGLAETDELLGSRKGKEPMGWKKRVTRRFRHH